MAQCPALLDGEYRLLSSSERVNLCSAYEGKVILVVNTASQCGFTGQFAGLETLYQRYQEQGFVVLGFPSDDFFQEHTEEEQTASVCQRNYGVTFPMFATSSVKGRQANALFKQLAELSRAPRWNFNKYLIGRDGELIEVFGSTTRPESESMVAAIERALATD